jgi:hypothetical protein
MAAVKQLLGMEFVNLLQPVPTNVRVVKNVVLEFCLKSALLATAATSGQQVITIQFAEVISFV